MDNALLSNRNPYQTFTAYNEKQLRFCLLAEKLITPSTSSMRTRISRFTHKKLTNMKLLWQRFIALDKLSLWNYLLRMTEGAFPWKNICK